VVAGLLDTVPVPLPAMRWLMPTGEALPPELARRWLERYPNIPLVNAYGPAECSDDVALYRVETPPDDAAHLPIGSATDNNRLYVLGAALEPSPVGATGELFVAGTGVGRGYAGAPAQTAAAFLPDPFADTPGGRLYRTGDLSRRRSDGLIEYVGRADQQVKIRGFRIELGEIEARLREHPAVREAGVVVHDTPAGKQLVGYASVEPGAVEPEGLRLHLKSRLPDYMVPVQLVLLDRLPRLPSGKLDRRSLPAPEWQGARLVAPRTPVETGLAEIWAELLGVERVGVTDDFFQLGGHSLLLTRMVSRVRATFGADVPLAELFGELTVEGMARRIQARCGIGAADEIDAMADILAELEQVP
jgi:acyl-CoA synthetase (AMP-forming)/AMP-acid ligase II